MNRFVAALGEELSLTSEEIADILWLVVQMGELPQPAASDAIEGSDAGKSRSPQRNDPPPKKNPIEPQIPDTSPPPAEIHLANDRSSFGGGLAISVPDARSLREPLKLARSLKPLLQRVASGWSNVLDEEATILKIDREQIWMPVLKPNLEAWLDLVLVVDESISMQIWQRTISELQRFLAHYGVFRDVRVYSLVVEDNQVYVRPRLGAASEGQSLRNPQELIDPSGRRLILVATDCVSAFWRSGEVLPALNLWAKSGPMAIVQMLPEWLWGRSGLGLASAVRFGSLQAGIPNHQLKATNLSLWDDVDLDLGIKVPVVTLEPEMMKTWAQLVAGKGGMQSPGFVFDPEPMPSIGEERSQVEVVSAGSGEERVRRFQVTASPMARQLAMILAAAPTISLPIVRILQDRLLPRSQQVHVAEVFLGGLLKPLVEVDAQSNPDMVPYEFMDGARDVLLDSVPTTEVVNVLTEVSQFVAGRLGLTLDEFMGVLRNPLETGDQEVVSQSRPFAMMTAQILRKLGGNYAQFAQELEQANRQNQSESDFTIDRQPLDIWNCVRTFSGHGDNITCVAFSPDGKFIVSSSDDQTIRLWDVREGKVLWRNGRHKDIVHFVTFSPDGQLIASASADKNVHLINLEGILITAFTEHTAGVQAIAFSPDGQLIASAGNDSTVKVWDLSGQVIQVINSGINNVINTVTFTTDGSSIIFSGSDTNIYVLDIKTLSAPPQSESFHQMIGVHDNDINSLAVHPNLDLIVSGSRNSNIRLSDLDGNHSDPFIGHTSIVWSVTFSPTEELIASGSRDKTIRLWDLEGNQVSNPLIGHKGGVNCITFNPDGRILVSCGADQKIKLWSKYPVNLLPFRTLSDFASCELLKTCKNTNINVLQSDSPWQLPFDALVVPVGKYGTLGFFGSFFNQYLDSIGILQPNLLQILIDRKMEELDQIKIVPSQPFILALESDISSHLFFKNKQIFIVCMTVESENTPVLKSASVATRATIDIAAKHGCKNLFLSLLKSEIYETTISEMGMSVLQAIILELESLEDNEIEEITLIERDPNNFKTILQISETLFQNRVPAINIVDKRNNEHFNTNISMVESIDQNFQTSSEDLVNFYLEMLEQHFDELKSMIMENFINHDYELVFDLHPREIDELNIDEVNLNDVTDVDIISISTSVDNNTATFEVSSKIVFSAEFTEFDYDGFIREIHEDTEYPTIRRLVPNQSVNATVCVHSIFIPGDIPKLEIELIDLDIQEPISVNYQDATFYENEFNIPVYHRLESSSQTIEIAKLQEESLEIWGGVNKNHSGSEIPIVKAHKGFLPKGSRGIEFTTNIPPDSGTPSTFAYWNGNREELTIKGDMAILKVLTVNNFQKQVQPTGKSALNSKISRSRRQPDRANLRKIQENISILRNGFSTDLEKISALKVLGRAIDDKQAIQAIIFLIRTNKNNNIISEAVKSLGSIGQKDAVVLQEMLRLLGSSSNNLVIIEVLTSLSKIRNTDSTTIRAVLHLLASNKNSLVIINIMKTFSLIANGNNEVIQRILSLLQSTHDANVKKSIIESLGEIAIGNRSAISQLILILRYRFNAPIIKQLAANSLGKIAVGDKIAISAMETELKTNSSKSVKNRIAVNLNKIDPKNKVASDYRMKTNKTRSIKK
jgi:WD40 repeat protein/HEAT repeat protein